MFRNNFAFLAVIILSRAGGMYTVCVLCANLYIGRSCLRKSVLFVNSLLVVRFAKLLWRWSQTSLHHPPPSSCQHRLTSLLGGGPSVNEVQIHDDIIIIDTV